jgi:hypothetical protein
MRDEGEGVGCVPLEMVGVGRARPHVCVVGAKSTTCVRVVRADGWGGQD